MAELTAAGVTIELMAVFIFTALQALDPSDSRMNVRQDPKLAFLYANVRPLFPSLNHSLYSLSLFKL